MLQIDIENWSFWSPESSDPSLWLKHWQRPGAEPGEDALRLDLIPAMQRRRMSRLAKMALSTALEVAADQRIDYSVFCSQHGEIVRTLGILDAISTHTEISPAAFAQSVHNTSSGLFTIISASHAPSMSIASGANTFAYAWLEAQAYISLNPKHRVLLVDFDEALPEVFQAYSTGTAGDHSVALMLRATKSDGISLSHSADAGNEHLPQGPRFLAWLQSGARDLSMVADGQGWRWAR
jgi:hypothetical protein